MIDLAGARKLLEKVLDVETSSAIDSIEADIEAEIRAGYGFISSHLPQLSEEQSNLFLFQLSKPSPLTGAWRSVHAFACGNTVYLGVNPRDSNLMKVLKICVIHELHHIVRYRYSSPHGIFLDWLVMEGLAGLFEAELLPSEYFLPCWSSVKQGDLEKHQNEVEKFWLDPEFSKDNERYNAWFFGSEKMKIPRWFGYSLGFNLVSRARRGKLRHFSWSELVQLDSREFLD